MMFQLAYVIFTVIAFWTIMVSVHTRIGNLQKEVDDLRRRVLWQQPGNAPWKEAQFKGVDHDRYT
jgi:cell division protein FtsL